jgi:adenylate kinase
MDIVLFGIQGSGKGTQARLLLQTFKYHYFEAGQELRNIIASGSTLGKEISSYIDNGNLVPYQIIINVTNEAIKAFDDSCPILFDGVPRDHEQMVAFDELMRTHNRQFHCIHFTLSKDEALRRIALRAHEQGRADDADPQKIEKRLSWFFEKNLPVIERYNAQGIMTEVDASRSIADVQQDLAQVIQKLQ